VSECSRGPLWALVARTSAVAVKMSLARTAVAAKSVRSPPAETPAAGQWATTRTTLAVVGAAKPYRATLAKRALGQTEE